MVAVAHLRRRLQGLCLLLLLTATAATWHRRAEAQNLRDAEKGAEKSFLKACKDYLSMEHNLPVAQLKPTADVQELDRRRVQLRTAVQQARPNAKQGDIFTAQTEPVFRMLLAHSMMGSEGAKIRTSLEHAEPLAPKAVAVNAVYPTAEGQPLQSTPPSLLAKLPVLPKGLEYRVAGRTLVLRDTEANLIVDYLPDALP